MALRYFLAIPLKAWVEMQSDFERDIPVRLRKSVFQPDQEAAVLVLWLTMSISKHCFAIIAAFFGQFVVYLFAGQTVSLRAKYVLQTMLHSIFLVLVSS